MKPLICLLLAATLAGCATPGGSTLTPEQEAERHALRRQAAYEFGIGRVRSAMAIGLINIRASQTQIFAADTACAALVLAALLADGEVIPLDVGIFCDEIARLLRETASA